MSSSFSPIDPATIADLNAGREEALEKIFRDHYPLLLERAIERLKGERVAAPKMIAATVRELWDERDGFHSSAEIEAFFNEELRHRARAARARLAAVHRFEKAEGVKVPQPAEPPTADQLWGEIAAGLHEPVVDQVAAAKQRRKDSSHDLASHISSATEARSWKGTAIVVAGATIVALSAAWFLSQKSRASVVNELLGAADAQTVSTRGGQIGSFTLGDSTRVRIAPESRIVYVPRFGTTYRVMSVSGSAELGVAPGNPVRFEARLGDITVSSEGGAFAVRDYANESYRMIRSTEGALGVRVGDTDRTLASGEALYIARDGEARAATEQELLRAFAWTEGRLVLSDVTVAAAAQSLLRWFGLEVFIADSASRERVVSISVPLESSQAAITAIETEGRVRFGWVSGKMVFEPAPAARRR